MKPEVREILQCIIPSYPGRPTISLEEFLRDFTVGTRGQPMKKKTARNQIYQGRFPLPVTNERILLMDLAIWLHRARVAHS